MAKRKEQKERRTHYLAVRTKKVTHDIGITGHDMLPSKAITTINIDCPRELWKVTELTNNRFLLLRFSTIRSHNKQCKGKREKKKRLSIYLSSKGRYEAGDVELLIVHSLKNPPNVGNAIPL